MRNWFERQDARGQSITETYLFTNSLYRSFFLYDLFIESGKADPHIVRVLDSGGSAMSKEKLRSLMRWLIFMAATILALTLLTRKDSHGHSGPVWKSFTLQEQPAAKH